MQVHIFAMAAGNEGLDHPLTYDVRVGGLTEPLDTIARTAITDGLLQTYRADQDAWWVSRVQLAVVVGFGRNLSDATDPCFVPPQAMLKVPYMTGPITDEVLANAPHQAKYLTAAGHTANYLAALIALQPPRPFDRHVAASDVTSPIRALIDADQLRTSPSDTGCWIISAEAAAHLPVDESFINPKSAWYIKSQSYAGHDELAWLTAAHRAKWPELYDQSLSSDCAKTILDLSAPFPPHNIDWPWPHEEHAGIFRMRSDVLPGEQSEHARSVAVDQTV